MKQKPLSFFTPILFVLAGIALADMAHAGHYDLIKSKGMEVCEAYGKNLNSRFTYALTGSTVTITADKPSRLPFRCDRPLNPEFKDFSKPEWKSMVRWTPETDDLLEKIDRFLWEREKRCNFSLL